MDEVLQNKHSVLDIMDRFEVLPWNNDSTIDEIDMVGIDLVK